MTTTAEATPAPQANAPIPQAQAPHPQLTVHEALDLLEQALDVTNVAKARYTPLKLDDEQKVTQLATLGWRGQDGEAQVLMAANEFGANLLASWACHGPNGLAFQGGMTNRAMLVACSMPAACQLAALPDAQGVGWLSTRAMSGGEASAMLFTFLTLVTAVRAACFPPSTKT